MLIKSIIYYTNYDIIKVKGKWLFLKKLLTIVFLFILLLCSEVKAETISWPYLNSNGVSLTENEYLFLDHMFYDGFHDVITADDYNKIFSEEITNGVINSNSTEYLSSNIYNPLATSHSTASKTLTISSSCSTNCLISIVANWKKSPVVRSYDLIGAYLSNVSLVGDITTIARNSTGTKYSSGTVQSINGFGESVLLLSSGSDMKIT